MSKGNTGEADVIRLRQNIQELLRRRILEAVQTMLEQELSEALGTNRYEGSDERRSYRNGHETRKITTGLGTKSLQVPRGRPPRSRCRVGKDTLAATPGSACRAR